MTCDDEEAFVGERIDRVLTQYRESPNLLGYARAILGQVHEARSVFCDMPERFDIADCTGEQLTVVAKRIGLQRCHCVCATAPVFGWDCTTSTANRPVVGFCDDGIWGDCDGSSTSDVCITDDEMFRGYVFARAFQLLRLYEIGSLANAAQQIWGDSATVHDMQGGSVAVSPGRDLTPTEELLVPVAFRVLPIAPGISPNIVRGSGKIFGFGDGWGGFCDGSVWLCPEPVNPYACG